MTESLAPSPPRLAGFAAGHAQALPVGFAPPVGFALGVPALDAALGGGLARGRLHEIHAASEVDAASATGFALMLALRAGGRTGNVVWLAQDRQPLYPPGLAELGADPARLLFVTVPDETMLLKAAADVVRSPAAGTAVIAPASVRRLDLTATRRLTLYAERSGVTAILLRGASAPAPSSAMTRWRIAAAPSVALEADAPGAPAFAADLVRRRGGPPSEGWRLEWDRDVLHFSGGQALPGALAAEPGRGELAAGGRTQ